MNVTRIHTDSGSHIEPELDPTWDDRTKLEWQAAVAAHDTGLQISIHDGTYSELVVDEWRPVPGIYSIRIGHSVSRGGVTNCSGFNFRSGWDFLHGVMTGAQYVKEQQ